MDKILSYFIIFSIIAGIIIAGNHFLTDNVGNFSMEKVENLIPNVKTELQEFVDKVPEITIGDPIESNKEPAIEHLVAPDKPPRSVVNNESVTKQYMTEMNTLENNNITSFQKEAKLKEIQDKYLGKKFYWSGHVNNVKAHGSYILLTMRIEDRDYKWNILFCEMALNDFSRISLRKIKKKDEVTVTGDYRRSDENPWINNCEIVTDQ